MVSEWRMYRIFYIWWKNFTWKPQKTANKHIKYKKLIKLTPKVEICLLEPKKFFFKLDDVNEFLNKNHQPVY